MIELTTEYFDSTMAATLAKVGVDVKLNTVEASTGDLTTMVTFSNESAFAVKSDYIQGEYTAHTFYNLARHILVAIDRRNYTMDVNRALMIGLREKTREPAMALNLIPFSSIILTSITATMAMFTVCAIAYESVKGML